MTTNPEEHDFIKEVCAGENCTAYSGPDSPEHSNECLDEAAKSQGWEFTNNDVPPRLSDDPLVRLQECRGYSASAAVASSTADRFDSCKPAFDEAIERAKFEAWANVEYGVGADEELNLNQKDVKANLVGWLACARSRHNESTMQGEE